MLSAADIAARKIEALAHTSEVDDMNDTDDLVRSEIAQLIDRLTIYGRTFGLSNGRHRYSALIDCLGDAICDGMPAARHHGDDPFAEGDE